MNRTVVGAAVAALCLGLAAGGSIVYQAMPEREPRACERLREEAIAPYLFAQSNLLSAQAARERAVGDPQAWREADSDVRAHLDTLKPITERYDALYAECEAAS